MAILARHGAKIAEEILIVWKGNKYRAWVQEEEGEWSPNFVTWGDKDMMEEVVPLENNEKSPEVCMEDDKSGESEATKGLHGEGGNMGKTSYDCGTLMEPQYAVESRVQEVYFFEAEVKTLDDEVGPKVFFKAHKVNSSKGLSKKNKGGLTSMGKGAGPQSSNSRRPGPIPDLNLHAEDPFDIDRIIWDGAFMEGVKKRKAVIDFSNTFTQEEAALKRSKKWVEVRSQFSRDEANTQIVDGAEEKAEKIEDGDSNMGSELANEVKDTVEVGMMTGVGGVQDIPVNNNLTGFWKDILAVDKDLRKAGIQKPRKPGSSTSVQYFIRQNLVHPRCLKMKTAMLNVISFFSGKSRQGGSMLGVISFFFGKSWQGHTMLGVISFFFGKSRKGNAMLGVISFFSGTSRQGNAMLGVISFFSGRSL
ncbi:hypothetical protein L1987_43536 [Smallanthus sonchifolius]|uniref:Uncharacterized protein n=1 Tax=Smallanthus sonchifolius TaxID=185202 RepID=A0ACB9GNY7_9ASTR|nr:hypothetical protein L1987_43536 [Smallanthus sonchifolius]